MLTNHRVIGAIVVRWSSARQASHLKLESMSFYLQVLFDLYAKLVPGATPPAKADAPPPLGSEVRTS